jgi:hypothetical protein
LASFLYGKRRAVVFPLHNNERFPGQNWNRTQDLVQ